MKKIKLTQDRYAMVDDEDFEYLNRFKWQYTHGYGRRTVKRKNIYLHQLIISPIKGMDIDHINGNSLDNRRSNLRVISHANNILNSRLSRANKSGYKGISWDKYKNKWKAKMQNNHIGYYEHIIDAIKARKLAEGL